MEYLTSQAIIMRIKEFGESDLLVTFFTPDRGQLKGIAKAARKSRKRFINCLETCSLVSLEYGIRKAGGLCFIRSGTLLDGFAGLREDFQNFSRASFMLELTGILFPSEVADRNMFDALQHSLGSLSAGGTPDSVLLAFEARALALGGYAIRMERCCVCGRTYTGAGRAVFKRERGSIACLRCQPQSAETPALSPESCATLSNMQCRLIEEPQDLGEEVIAEIRSVIRLHREYRLEQRLKTSKYL
jgi:DNA repair protein RecO (recombination protein O)